MDYFWRETSRIFILARDIVSINENEYIILKDDNLPYLLLILRHPCHLVLLFLPVEKKQ